MKNRISMITLGVDDLDASIAFYRDVFGFARVGSEDGIAFFELNGSWLCLYGKDGLAKDAKAEVGTGFPNITLSQNLASEAEVDQTYAALIAAGATPVSEPHKAYWGGYSSYVADPDGYRWELAHNPFGWIGPRDD